MNPVGVTGDPDNQNRPSVFSDLYPPPTRAPFDWNSQYQDYNAHQNPGFNMQPQTTRAAPWPNFQFGENQNAAQTVQFPFPTVSSSIPRPMYTFRCKRKTDSSPTRAAKQLITEEKMSEHLSKLHISSETPDDMESDEVKERRLYMCEEMKRFQAQTDSILPESLMCRINRPCTALVLWKPPSSILLPSMYNRDEESENNNNNSSRDYNPVNAPVNDMDFEEL